MSGLETVCHSCGNRVIHGRGERPCDVLGGWLMVARWEGPGVVEHYAFCCIPCLKNWADMQVPDIPQVFLSAFDSGEDGDAYS
jgi:hypothetical protein